MDQALDGIISRVLFGQLHDVNHVVKLPAPRHSVLRNDAAHGLGKFGNELLVFLNKQNSQKL